MTGVVHSLSSFHVRAVSDVASVDSEGCGGSLESGVAEMTLCGADVSGSLCLSEFVWSGMTGMGGGLCRVGDTVGFGWMSVVVGINCSSGGHWLVVWC